MAAVALLAFPAVSEAQVRIGIGSGGGGWGNPGWGNPGWGGGGWGNPGWGSGYGRGYYGPGYGNRSGISIGIGSGGYYGPGGYYQRGYTPYIGSSTFSPSTNFVVPSGSTQTYSAYQPAATSSGSNQDGTASITVHVPPHAEVFWNGSRSTLSGEYRRFRTLPLSQQGTTQTFQARWQGPDGQMVTQTREVQVTPNEHFTVDFTQNDQQGQPQQQQQQQQQRNNDSPQGND